MPEFNPSYRQWCVDGRNARNLEVWRARRAWYDHNGHTPRDPRTPEQQRAWREKFSLTWLGAPGYFIARQRGFPFEYFTIDMYAGARACVHHGVEIDLGDVIFDWCKPDAGTRGDFEQRQARGESLGIGDAPGSARIVDELVRYETHERPLTEAVRAKYMPPR